MRKTKYVLLIILFALVALVFIPNTSNAAVSVERTLLTNDGSMKFKFSGLTLDTTHEYQFGFEKTSAIESTKWYDITEFTATTATVNITTNSNHLAVFDAGDTGYITIKDKTADIVVEKAHAVDLKLPYLNVTNYDKAITNGYDLGNNAIRVGARNARNSKAYYQYEKVTDQAVISKYKEIKKSNGSIKELQNVIKTSAPANSNWTQWNYFNEYNGHGGGYGNTQRNVSVPDEGLYYMWLYFQGTNIKDIYGCIMVDNLTDEIALTFISLPSTKEVELGKTLTLTPTFNPSNTTDKTVTWTSSDESVATVNGNGVVTPKKVGSTIITVTSNVGKKTAKCTVTVKSTSSSGTGSSTTDGWTDASKASIKVTDLNGTQGSTNLQLTIEGIAANKNNTYFLYLTNGKNKPSLETDSYNWIKSGYTETIIGDNFTNPYISKVQSERISWAFEKSGDVYAWIIESKYVGSGKYENKYIVEGYKINRPSSKNLGARISGYFTKEDTSIYYWGISAKARNASDSRKVKIKIGKVDNTSILRAIKNKESGALNKLLEYSKSAKSIYTFTTKIGESNSITDKIGIADKQYYYVYYELDDENGTYYPVEDVMLYQALVDNESRSLHSYLDKKFVWTLSDDTSTTPTEDKTVAPGTLPQTGETMIIIGTIAIITVIAVVAGIQIKKYKF